ncbi:MAG: CinA family protein [Eubacteriales bacterium]|nr:CinA family protein [Eubacteriales bacterium]
MANIRDVEKKYQMVVAALRERHLSVSALESCTGGLVASLLTDVSGASEVFPGGYVTYSNGQKVANGVARQILEEYGVYSPEMAEGMAMAAIGGFQTNFGIGITGSLGRKDPANADSVPGVVYLSVIGPIKKPGNCGVRESREKTHTDRLVFVPRKDTPANRRQAKLLVADAAAELLLAAMDESC